MMDCNETNRDELIDRYLRNEMPEKEAGLFEEHLLSCSACRNELTGREKIIKEIEKLSAGETFQIGGQSGDLTKNGDLIKNGDLTKKRSNILWYVVAAAGVALVIGLFLLPERNTPTRSSQSAYDEIQADTIQSPQSVEDEPVLAFESEIASLPDYRIYPVYESLIGVSHRSEYMKVKSPHDSVVCKSGSTIEIEFHNIENDSLFLVILNNQGEILRENRIASPYILHMHYSKGLYYWQLTNEEESLHTAKIYIR